MNVKKFRLKKNVSVLSRSSALDSFKNSVFLSTRSLVDRSVKRLIISSVSDSFFNFVVGSVKDLIRSNLHNKFRKKYTYIELVQAINDILPGAILGEDDEGQIVIYTNLTEIENQEELADFEA